MNETPLASHPPSSVSAMHEARGASRWEIFVVALKLGCTSFGGPVAHLGYFHAEYVRRRRWLSEAAYADLVALCQFLPGPASSQLGFSIGLLRGGLLGGLCAWLGFTLPSAVLMTLCGYGLVAAGGLGRAGWLHGLKLAAVAVVAQAVWALGTKLCPDRARASAVIVAAGAALTIHAAWGQCVILVLGVGFGLAFLREEEEGTTSPIEAPLSVRGWNRRAGLASLILFVVLLAGLPMLRSVTGNAAVAETDGFYRAGALVFGGGHVVLPLLQTETVAQGWVDNDRFLAGYGLAQAVPGPLFTFAAYLGAASLPPHPGGWIGAQLCLVAIFLPSGLLVLGVLPFWDTLRRQPGAQAALRGANAAVVGLLLAALYQPVWTSAVQGVGEFVLALGAYGLLVFWRCPAWLVVGLAAAAGEILLR